MRRKALELVRLQFENGLITGSELRAAQKAINEICNGYRYGHKLNRREKREMIAVWTGEED